jgi:hypothetical protein
MNPFATPSYLQFDASRVKTTKTPQMSRLQPASPNILQSRITDTKASAQARANVLAPTPAPKAAAPAAPSTPAKSPSKPKPSTSKSTSKSAEQKYQEDVRRQIEDAYKAQLGFLSGQERSLESQLPDFLSAIAKPFEAQRPLLEQQLAEQREMGMRQQEDLRMQEQQALAGARRSAEEAGLRAIQQFGGVAGSSAAQAAGELIGREQLRQQGSIQQQRAQGIQNINDQLRAIQGEFNAQVANLNLQKEQSLSKARLDFQQQLDSIKKEKMTAGVTKAQMTIDALGLFAERRRQIEDQITTQQNNLNFLRETATLNAQNANLQQSVTGQNISPLPFRVGNFFTDQTGNQSNELAKVLQAGVAAGTIKPFATTAEGIDLFTDLEDNIVDIRGNRYRQ